MTHNKIDYLRSNLSKAKGLGAARNGTKTWWSQRLSSIALLPIITWFVFIVVKMSKASYQEMAQIIGSPFNSVMLMTMIFVAIYHSTLGMKEIIEDYVHCEKIKVVLIILLKFVSYFTMVFGLVAAFVFHFMMFSSN